MERALQGLDPRRALVAWVRLDKGSDVTDLTVMIDVIVCRAGASSSQVFTIASIGYVKDVFDSGFISRSFQGVYVTGCPFAVVETLTPDNVVLAIIRYVTLESRRQTSS